VSWETDADERDRELFCTCVNAYMTGKTGGRRYLVKFIDHYGSQDVLAVIGKWGKVVLINVHMNSIDATARAFAQWLATGECQGLICTAYPGSGDGVPEWAMEQITEDETC
jgi:hypothetical protein